MTAGELAAHLKEATGVVERDEVSPSGELSIWVPLDKWVETAGHLKECGRCRFNFFTFLTAVDWEDEGLEIVCHVYSVRREHHVNVRTRVPKDDPKVPTLTGVWRGANWHERETWELFGVEFEGHPKLAKLLLPEAFDGHPLRKSFTLMTREAKEWPGLKEPE